MIAGLYKMRENYCSRGDIMRKGLQFFCMVAVRLTAAAGGLADENVDQFGLDVVKDGNMMPADSPPAPRQ